MENFTYPMDGSREELRGATLQEVDQHAHDLATGEGMPEATVSETASEEQMIEAETEVVELELSECGCDSCIEEGGDDFKMLFDMYTQLASRVAELESRVAAHNVKASHKI